MRYPSIQQIIAGKEADSPCSRLLQETLSCLDEIAYHAKNGNEDRVKTRVIDAAVLILQLPKTMPPSGIAELGQAVPAEADGVGEDDDDRVSMVR